MDPTQNDSFDSFSNGQGGGVQAGGVSGVTTGGPIVLNNGGGKSNKWVWVIVIVLAIVAVGGGVFAVWKSGVFGGGGNSIDQKAVKDAFGKYRNLLINGTEDVGEKEQENEVKIWAFDNLVLGGVYTIKEGEYLKSIKKYYDEFWIATDNNTINQFYNQLFGLLYNCANRNGIVLELEQLDSGEVNKYVDGLIGEGHASALEGLVFAERSYFENYNAMDKDGYLAFMVNSVESYYDNFKKMTDYIYNQMKDDENA